MSAICHKFRLTHVHTFIWLTHHSFIITVCPLIIYHSLYFHTCVRSSRRTIFCRIDFFHVRSVWKCARGKLLCWQWFTHTLEFLCYALLVWFRASAHTKRESGRILRCSGLSALFRQINNVHNELQKANPLRINSVAERNCPTQSKISSNLLRTKIF